MAKKDTAVTSNGGSVYARLLCSLGCGSVMVYDMDANNNAGSYTTPDPCPDYPSG